VEGLEATFRARRGVDHVLSPREFALARGWFEAGISLATVLVAVDLAFDSDPSVSSLSFCRRRVEQLAAGAGAHALREQEAARPSLPDLAERLQALRGRLLELPARAAALPLQELAETSDLVAVASRPNWSYLEGRLARIDELVSAAALEALGQAELDALREEASRAADRQRGRVDPRALEEAVERLVRQRARERLQLPRVAVF
jgi:hypothetical protein